MKTEKQILEIVLAVCEEAMSVFHHARCFYYEAAQLVL